MWALVTSYAFVMRTLALAAYDIVWNGPVVAAEVDVGSGPRTGMSHGPPPELVDPPDAPEEPEVPDEPEVPEDPLDVPLLPLVPELVPPPSSPPPPPLLVPLDDEDPGPSKFPLDEVPELAP